MTISIDDRQLVEAYQSGDSHAFADLVRAHSPSLLGHAIRSLGDRAAAEDAVQETFVRAYRALPSFDGDYRVGPWLHRILSNVCHDEGNRRRRDAEKFDRFAADPYAVELAPGVEDELGLDIDDTNLASVLESLPASYREALNLRFVQELSYDEVARAAGVSEQNARARVSRARSAARSALRGVAAIPALLIPALRRGETVAAAASHSDNMRMATEAALVSAPAATPLLTKAVIGLSLVAAVATPSPDALNAGPARSFGAAEVSSVESAAPADPAPYVASAEPTRTEVIPVPDSAPVVTAAAVPGTSGAAPDTADPVEAPVPLPANPSTDASTEPDPDNGGADGPDGDVVVAPAPAERVAGDLTVSGLVLTAAGPRFDLSGDTTLVLGDRTVTGATTGRLTFTDQDGVRRYTIDLVATMADGAVVDLRLQLQGRPAAGQADRPLADVTVFDLAGMFRASSDTSEVNLLESGQVSGSLDLDADRLVLRLAS